MITPEYMDLVDYADPLLKKYEKRLNVLSDSVSLSQQEAVTTAILLENTDLQLRNYKIRKSLTDSTFSEQVGPFIKHAMNLVSTMYTTFDLKDLISIQPMKQKLGAIYTMNYEYSSNKGTTRSGDVMFSPNRAPQPSGYYATEEINKEKVVGHWDSTAHTYTFNTQFYPLYTNEAIQLKVEGGGTAVGMWVLSDGEFTNGTTKGSINYSDGTIVLSGVTADVTSAEIKYMWNSEHNRNLIPSMTVRVEEDILKATRRIMKFDMSLDASLDFNNQFAKDMATEVESTVLQEMQNQLSYLVLDKMFAGCDTTQTFSWSQARPNEISNFAHYESLFRMLSEMSTYLFKSMGRGKGNKIVCGTTLGTICESLPGNYFVPENVETVRGPHKLGRLLNKFDVYLNPAYPDDEFIMLYKGKDWWEAPYYIGSYLPLMATQFMMFPDFRGEQGYIAMDAHKYLHPKHVVKAKITN